MLGSPILYLKGQEENDVPFFWLLLHPEGPTYTTIMESGPQNQNRDGFLGA